MTEHEEAPQEVTRERLASLVEALDEAQLGWLVREACDRLDQADSDEFDRLRWQLAASASPEDYVMGGDDLTYAKRRAITQEFFKFLGARSEFVGAVQEALDTGEVQMVHAHSVKTSDLDGKTCGFGFAIVIDPSWRPMGWAPPRPGLSDQEAT